MRILLSCTLAVLLLLAAGCSSGPRIDGSSPEAFASSLKHAAAELAPKEKARFNAAIALITLNIGGKAAMEGKDPVKALGDELDGLTAEEIIGLGDRMAKSKQ